MGQIASGDGGAPVALNVLDDELCAAVVRDIRPLTRVVHGVRQVTRQHFHEYDYILAMDRGHLRQLRALAPAGSKARLGMFLDASARWKGEDVPDPYYGGDQGFEQVLDMVEEAAHRWLDIIEAELDPARFQLRNPR